jgi:hypothetical protein
VDAGRRLSVSVSAGVREDSKSVRERRVAHFERVGEEDETLEGEGEGEGGAEGLPEADGLGEGEWGWRVVGVSGPAASSCAIALSAASTSSDSSDSRPGTDTMSR